VKTGEERKLLATLWRGNGEAASGWWFISVRRALR